MILNKDVLVCVFLLFIAQIVIWFQLNGQLKWEWFKDNYFLMSLMGIPISYVLLLTTKYGFQTPSDLFVQPTGLITDLEKIINDRVEDYCLKYSSEDCLFVKMFPKKTYLVGWFVRLLKGGHQDSHIHTSGWLSGVLYLKLPIGSDPKEGAISFGLWGYNYPILDENYPEKEYHPNSGDIILFPSSLFHKTNPFNSDEERMSIAFDLIPVGLEN